MTHWFITKAKAQEIQRDDPMEALCEWFPDLYAERTYIFLISFKKKKNIGKHSDCRAHATCRRYLVPVIAGGGEAM